MLFNALALFHSVSAEVRKAPEVQPGTTPRPNEKGELPALLSGLRVLHFHRAPWCVGGEILVFPGASRTAHRQSDASRGGQLSLSWVFSCYKKVLCLCLIEVSRCLALQNMGKTWQDAAPRNLKYPLNLDLDDLG